MSEFLSPLPSFIGIGAPKAATTWLTAVLASHPGIYLPALKETHFFDYPYTQYPFSHYSRFFSDVSPGQIVGEYSVDYLASPEAPARIRRHLPDVRLIVSFRDPVDQIYSHYWHCLRQGFNCRDATVPDFETALARFPDKLLEESRFGHHLQRWLEHFPADRFLVVFQEDVAADPAAVAARLWDFLGVPPPHSEHPLPGRGGSERAGVSPRSGGAARLYNRLYFAANNRVLRPLSRRFGYETSLRLIRILRLRGIAERLFFRPGYPPMTPAQRARIRALLADDVALLSRLTGRDLSHWK